MTWRTTGPERWSPVVGNGKSWILDGNLDVLLDPEFEPQRDPLEHAEYFVEQDGETWLQTYYDSPATLRLKLALARDQGSRAVASGRSATSRASPATSSSWPTSGTARSSDRRRRRCRSALTRPANMLLDSRM